MAARVLGTLEVTLEEVRGEVTRIVGEGEHEAQGQIPFTPRAKKVLELALREAFRWATTTSAPSTYCWVGARERGSGGPHTERS